MIEVRANRCATREVTRGVRRERAETGQDRETPLAERLRTRTWPLVPWAVGSVGRGEIEALTLEIAWPVYFCTLCSARSTRRPAHLSDTVEKYHAAACDAGSRRCLQRRVTPLPAIYAHYWLHDERKLVRYTVSPTAAQALLSRPAHLHALLRRVLLGTLRLHPFLPQCRVLAAC